MVSKQWRFQSTVEKANLLFSLRQIFLAPESGFGLKSTDLNHNMEKIYSQSGTIDVFATCKIFYDNRKVEEVVL